MLWATFLLQKVWCILNHFYSMHPIATEFGEITQCRSSSFKVTDFGTNQKLIYDFLLVIYTILPPILHRFRDIAFDRSKIAIFGYPFAFLAPDGGVLLG